MTPAGDAGVPAAGGEPADASTIVAPDDEPLLVVGLGDAEFGLPIAAVREVMRPPAISRIPFPPPDVTGLIGVRGVVLPLLDLGLRVLGRPARRPGTVIVADDPGTHEPIALLVDRVSGLVRGAWSDRVEPPPEAEATLPLGWVTAVHVPEPGRPIAVLDLSMVLPNPSLDGSSADEPQSTLDSEQ